jgi:sugar lactone lactonase YvrE
MAFDGPTGLLFVAGASTGQGYVYDTATGISVAQYQFATGSGTFINDVTVTRDGAWFTDSVQPRLYFVPLRDGVPGAFSTLEVTGPAAALTGPFNLNGIASTATGLLVVAHSANGRLYTVDPGTGASTLIAGVAVPNVDGIILDGHRLWAVQNSNQVSVVRLDAGFTSGVVDSVVTSPLLETPSTAARHGSTLAVVNAKFDTGFPPTATEFEVVLLKR